MCQIFAIIEWECIKFEGSSVVCFYGPEWLTRLMLLHGNVLMYGNMLYHRMKKENGMKFNFFDLQKIKKISPQLSK